MKVLVGTYRQANYKWIREHKLYNLPWNEKLGLDFYQSFAYIVLINGKNPVLSGHAKFKEVVSSANLGEIGYKVSGHQEKKYALYELHEESYYDPVLSGAESDIFVCSRKFNGLIDKEFYKKPIDKKYKGLLSIFHFLQPYVNAGKIVRFSDFIQADLFDRFEKDDACNDRFTSEIEKKKIKFIDLFAGIGGIRLGFERAFADNEETVFVSEWDEYAKKTYSANFHDSFEIKGDITKIDEKTIPHFDICLAGFPCQAFSLAGQRKGFEDNYRGKCRGTLFLDVARICDYHKPKVIFCENVKGLVIHDHGNTFKIICETFADLGYKVFSKILNSKDFGVPQNRERIYIVAFRNDIAPENFDFPESTDNTKRLRDIIEAEPVPAKYYLSDVYIETLRRHKARHEAKGNGFGYEIREWDSVAGAIVCGGMGRERNLLIDKRQKDLSPTTHIKGGINSEGIRKMTPREWARLQGFSDSFQLPLADVHLYKQFGNSVTVNVIEAIAKKIKEVLDNA